MIARLIKRFQAAPSTIKVAMTYAVSASIVLTGYYYARIWAAENRDEALSVRHRLNDEFSIESLKEQRKLKVSAKE